MRNKLILAMYPAAWVVVRLPGNHLVARCWFTAKWTAWERAHRDRTETGDVPQEVP
jgi:hypothetical protein